MKLSSQLFMVVAVLLAAAYGGYWVRGQDAAAEIAELRRTFDAERLETARVRESQFARTLAAERQLNKELTEVLDETRKQRDEALATAGRNRDRNRVLSDEVARLLDALGDYAADPSPAAAGEAKAIRAGVHELLEVAGAAAADLASEADEARAAGLSCERAYDRAHSALTKIRLGDPPP